MKGGSGNRKGTTSSDLTGSCRVLARVTPWVTLGCRVLLAVVLGYAGYSKVTEPLGAARAVRAYQILPESAVTTVGYGLPFLEIVLALLLLVGLATRFAGLAAALLMLVFIAGIASVWARGISIDCGCFGGGGQVAAGQTQYPWDILRDAGLFLAAAWIAVFAPGRFALDGKILGDPVASR
ncbi:MAG: DoxX family membrane protein [Streptosporangiales bacterium]|nr:DoxX family membrane protein [Streptosporangiales bacterium]MBO0891062.1 DoxX family membrane protein [Acidothermales bacterium]